MSKRDTTIAIEFELIKLFFLKKGMRFGLEVDVPYDRNSSPENLRRNSARGRCDFVAITNGGEVTCIEIKISKSDFKSKNGHNLIGHKNYYAMPVELLHKVNDLIPSHVGVYCLEDGKLSNYIPAKTVRTPYISRYNFNDKLRKDMLTACNSTIRRIYKSLLVENCTICGSSNTGDFDGKPYCFRCHKCFEIDDLD